MQETHTIGPRTFVLDRAKRVGGGRETMTFNLLPLRYGWAYERHRVPAGRRAGRRRRRGAL